MSDVNYRFTENGIEYEFDDVFIPADIFRQPALWSWGRNESGHLGINASTDRSTPVTTFLGGTNWKSVAGIGSHSAAIKTDGTLWIYGINSFGQLGINNTINRSTPVTTFLGENNWKSITGGYYHTVALKTDGTLWTWGRNNNGQLGINNTINRSTPVTTILGGTNWKSIAAGNSHTAAIKTDGTLWVWGYNFYGQLGINNTINRSTPVTTFLGVTDWKLVSSRGYHTTAIKSDGTLWAWGLNRSDPAISGDLDFGQLGDNTSRNRSTPVTTFLGGTNWKSVSAGGLHTTAIKNDGTLWAWGWDYEGQLGINSGGGISNRDTPVTTILGGTNWKSVYGGFRMTAAIKTDGTLWLWGNNAYGQLGINDFTNRDTPVTTILGKNEWKEVSGGYNHTIANLYAPDP
jgi:alpha-tubulin suppressor-like RCC1 family protein